MFICSVGPCTICLQVDTVPTMCKGFCYAKAFQKEKLKVVKVLQSQHTLLQIKQSKNITVHALQCIKQEFDTPGDSPGDLQGLLNER